MSDHSTITEYQVDRWLRENPDFFRTHADLLPAAITASGRVLSLESGKLDHLQRQNEQIREQLDGMLERVRRNEEIYRTLHTIQVGLIGARTLFQLVKAATSALELAFDISRVTLALSDCAEGFGLTLENRPPELADRVFVVSQAVLNQMLGDGRSTIIRIGMEGGGNRHLFFGTHTPSIRSEALVPLSLTTGGSRKLLGSLNLGGTIPSRFIPSYSTDLVQDLSEVIALCLKRMLPSGA
ncbi:MAG: DUF484 family protein [Magnetococcales bacterium]|nr:DUF484 family protein [Magnetococcales bacterium]MBF0322849.1 DUF484 family protein [Magnetococcales bacterium]